MEAEQVVCQSRLGRRTEFRFGQDKLVFSLSDYSGKAESSAFYEAIDTENTSLVSVNAGRRYYWMVLAPVLLFSYILSSTGSIAKSYSSAPLVAYLVFLLVARYKKIFFVPYTILTVSGGGRIRVIRDKNHDRVLDRIKGGRRLRLRKLHMTVDAAGDLTAEAKKFRLLLDNGIIDETEYRSAIGQIHAWSQSSIPTPNGPETSHSLN